MPLWLGPGGCFAPAGDEAPRSLGVAGGLAVIFVVKGGSKSCIQDSIVKR